MNRFLLFAKTKKGKYLFLAVFAILAVWGGLRGCSSHPLFAHPRYTVAVDRSWYPLSLYGKDSSLLAFTDELLEAISQQSGLRFTLLEVQTPSLMRDLDSGVYDAIISSLPPTYLNELKYHFSHPIYLIGPVLLVPADSALHSLNDLTGHFLGIRRGATLNFDAPFPSVNIVPYDNATMALTALEDNQIDALVMDSLQAYVQIQGIYTGKLKIATKPLTQEGLRLISLHKPNYDELFAIFNKSLQELIENGKYAELTTRWGLFNPYANYQ